MQKDLKVTIDINRPNYTNLKCVQGDDVKLIISLLQNNTFMDLSNIDVKIIFANANNTMTDIPSSNITKGKDSNNNDVVNVNLPNNCTKSVGTAKFQVELSSNNTHVSTFILDIEVNKSVISNIDVSKNIILDLESFRQLKEEIESKKITIEQFIQQTEALINKEIVDAQKLVSTLDTDIKTAIAQIPSNIIAIDKAIADNKSDIIAIDRQVEQNKTDILTKLNKNDLLSDKLTDTTDRTDISIVTIPVSSNKNLIIQSGKLKNVSSAGKLLTFAKAFLEAPALSLTVAHQTNQLAVSWTDEVYADRAYVRSNSTDVVDVEFIAIGF